jgi:hypothetical protein
MVLPSGSVKDSIRMPFAPSFLGADPFTVTFVPALIVSVVQPAFNIAVPAAVIPVQSDFCPFGSVTSITKTEWGLTIVALFKIPVISIFFSWFQNTGIE